VQQGATAVGQGRGQGGGGRVGRGVADCYRQVAIQVGTVRRAKGHIDSNLEKSGHTPSIVSSACLTPFEYDIPRT
jgi:hypothetical protein